VRLQEAADYGSHRIRINAALPRIIQTPEVGWLADDPTLSAYFRELRERFLIGRFGQSGEVGGTVKWLLLDAASFVSGASISVDGGYLAI